MKTYLKKFEVQHMIGENKIVQLETNLSMGQQLKTDTIRDAVKFASGIIQDIANELQQEVSGMYLQYNTANKWVIITNKVRVPTSENSLAVDIVFTGTKDDRHLTQDQAIEMLVASRMKTQIHEFPPFKPVLPKSVCL